jgi:NAD(P)-dependent dehydrogenase (short-subunit alcohol dehydrogenase family)
VGVRVRVEDQAAVVAGSARGIGHAIADILVSSGAMVDGRLPDEQVAAYARR